MTSTTLGWILTDGEEVDGPTLAGAELPIRRGRGGLETVNASEEAAAAVVRLRTAMEAQGQRLHGIGVTWSGDAAAEAALLFESLTDAGFDNVVPVRFRQAAEALPGGLSEHAALCLIEPGRATMLMMDGCQADVPGVNQHEIDDADDVLNWLSTLFTAGGRRPPVLILSGSYDDLDALAGRAEATLGFPVVAETGAQLALARGAALAVEPGAEFGDEPVPAPPEAAVPGEPPVGQARPRPLTYAGALTMLVVGVLTFVVSLSITLSLQLAPETQVRASEPVAKSQAIPNAPVAAPVSEVAAPPVPEGMPPAESAEPPVEAFEPAITVDAEESPAAGAETPAPADVSAAPQSAVRPGRGHALLDRARQHLSGLRGHLG